MTDIAEDLRRRQQLGLLARAQRKAEAPTPYWTAIRERHGVGPTGIRLAYMNDAVRFKIVMAGRRSTKTLIAKRLLVRGLKDPRRWTEEDHPEWWKEPPFASFYGAPTQDQAEGIAWEDLLKLIPIDWVKRIYRGSKPVIQTNWNSEVHVLGLDSPERIEGRPWVRMVLDEFPDIKEDAWERNIFPTLSDRKAEVIILGVPDAEKPNNDAFLRLFDKGCLLPGQSEYDSNFKSYTWTSEDVLSAEECQLARSSMSARAYRVEYLASRESMPGLAYPDFTRARHVHSVEYDPSLPLMISCDFNRRHHNWGEYQYMDGRYRILNDIYILGGTVEAMCEELRARLRKKKLPEDGKGIQFFGDYSGEQKRAEATQSSWRQILMAFPSAEFLYRVQPPVTDRLEKVNGIILNAANETLLDVDPSAINHIKDFERVSRTMAFAGEGGKDGELTHASSAFGYLVHQHQILLGRQEPVQSPVMFY